MKFNFKQVNPEATQQLNKHLSGKNTNLHDIANFEIINAFIILFIYYKL